MSEFDYEMPKEYKELLLYMVNTAKKNHVLSVSWLIIGLLRVPGEIRIIIGNEEKNFEKLLGNPMMSFHVLNLVVVYSNEETKGSLCLTPKAYEWAKYQRKNKLGKWIAKRSREEITFILAVFASVLSIILTLLKFIP